MSQSACAVYVYYRAASSLTDLVLAAMKRHHQQLLIKAIDIQFSRRPDESNGQTTWMETIVCDSLTAAEAISREIENSASTSELSALTTDGRHVEIFLSVPI